MKLYMIHALAFFAIVFAQLGCGDDPSLYQGEILTYENPISSERKESELDLSEEQKSDFGIASLGGWPWGPFPIFDYYRELVPVGVPVFPGFLVTDFIHPMYAFAFDNGFWDNDDDNRRDCRRHRHHDKHRDCGCRHHNDD